MKLISFIIPCYNSSSYMRHCIESILPGGDDVEILIVNDGSNKDNTLEIAKEYEQKYPNICRTIDKENGGHGSTINKALEIATGKYFRPIDGDDWIKSENLSSFIKILNSTNSDAVISNFDEIYVISSEDEKNFWDKKYERLNKRLIEQSNSKFTEMCDYTKKNVDEIINKLRNELSVKNVVNITRSSLRKEFYNIYKDKEKEVFKKAQDEFDKE